MTEPANTSHSFVKLIAYFVAAAIVHNLKSNRSKYSSWVQVSLIGLVYINPQVQ